MHRTQVGNDNLSDLDEYMLTGDVARRFDVSAVTVRLWSDCGRLRSLRTASGTRLFARRDVEQFAQWRAK
ncbi:MAG: hypothetical protein DMF84_11555 [Acidobacteria bacterium]|nr:MAG: hypothetical protein DMF84_11555 [Acidobacteriota bacterium]